MCTLAQTALPLHALPPGAAPPRIDGRLDDAAWSSAPVFDALRRFRPDVQPDAGRYRTEVRVLVERGALVFGIRAFDPDPAAIRAPLSRRDQVWPDQDSVTVWIDPSGRGQLAQFVRVNAAGSVRDGLYAAAVDDEDESPDFLEVEAATQRLADGWSAEIRWPLAMLRYPLDSERPWRLMLTRRVPRDAPLTFASVPLTREDPHLLARLQTFDDEAPLRAQLREARHLVLRPELTLRDQGDGAKANLGAELQWRPRADWVFDALWKPDFSQVELDEPQLAGNTRYALFVQEKRSFFLESSDLVGQVAPDDWDISRGLLAFYSRAVSSPRSGLRASFRGDAQEATALLVRDAGGGLRLRPDAFNSNSQDADAASTLLFARHRFQLSEGLALAPLLSLRDWADGTRTQVAGADFLWNPNGDWRLRGHWLHGGEKAQQDSALWLSARWRRGDWKLQWDSERIGARFVNDNGFVPQNGIARHTFDLLHAFHPEDSLVTVWEALLRVVQTDALRDPTRGVLARQPAGRLLQPGLWMASGSSELYAFANLEQQRTRPGGRLHEPRTLIVGVDLHPGPVWTYAHLELSGGRRVDQDADRTARGHNLNLQSVWRIPLAAGRNIELDQRWSAGTVKAPGGGAALDERSLQTKLLLHWRQDQALRLLWQVQTFKRVDEPGVIEGERSRTRTGTLTWLAREGPLRGWSLGGSWSREDGHAIQREVFVKYQQGWSLL
jgi:hypothetical protein